MYKLIYDENELKKYFDIIMQPLLKTEVFFISLSARNKYLTKEEREFYQLGRTEMFVKNIIRDYNYEKFIRTIRRFETNEGSYLTKNGKDIPSKCIIIYMNINPSSTIKAFKEFNKTMNEYMFELAQCSINGQEIDNISNKINKMNNLLMTCYQKNVGSKYWIDVDFDIPKEAFYLIEIFTNELKINNVNYYIINTKNGYHVLLKKDTINYNFNETIKLVNEIASKKLNDFEIILNKNAMIPLPGTYQGDYEVKFV